MNIRVASQFAEQLTTCNLRELGNFKEISESISRTIVLDFSVKYKFGTKIRSNWSSKVLVNFFIF